MKNNEMKTEESKNQESEEKALKLGVNWTDLRGKIKDEFPSLTSSDLQFMARGENELIGRMQIKSGRTKSQIREWIRSTAKIL